MSKPDPSAPRLFAVSIGFSALLAAALGSAYWLLGSELALAQAADSVADVLTAAGLLWAMRVSHRPPDEGHPFGHQNAQPIAALIVAVLAGVLAAEVLREAVQALITSDVATTSAPLFAALGAKVALKIVLAGLAHRATQRHPSAALGAFIVDARNDVVIGLASIIGLVASSVFRLPMLDAWLAIPIALWIGWSGVTLGLENAELLMGAAPAAERLESIRDLASTVPGVVRVGSLDARHHGNDIHVWLEIRVDPDLTVRAAHDIGEAVERRLVDLEDVYRADVHVDGIS